MGYPYFDLRFFPNFAFARLLISFHGLPEDSIQKGDNYYFQCAETCKRIKDELKVQEEDAELVFQSRFGYKKWLSPYLNDKLVELGSNGTRTIDVISPGFPIDCCETIDEIERESAELLKTETKGAAKLRYIPCLNETSAGVDVTFNIIRNNVAGWIEES
eukprot:GHVU01034826.1.p1 GENE.GHVU01034826.1~~GHVU01034826.1.p1  ORF type:complete len:160 (-),score=23.65 GHVU01034826.1:52-531(-)